MSENKMDYAVLHAHDTYGSIGDSILKIKDYVAKAKELGDEVVDGLIQKYCK